MEPAFTHVKPPKHPASIWWNLAIFCLFFTVVLGIFSSFYPAWSRMGKGEPAAIAAAYPTSVLLLRDLRPDQLQQSRLFMGHWQNMLEVNDPSNIYWIYDVDTFEFQTTAADFGYVKCRGFLFASRILELIGWGLAFMSLVLAIWVVMTLGKWLLKGGWKPPKAAAFLAFVLAVLAFGCLLTAWICWIVLVETDCRPGVPRNLRNPIQGYSYSFVTACFASGLALFASLFMCLGLMKFKQPVYAPEPKEMYVEPYPEMFTAMPQYPAYPEYPVQEQMYVAPPVYMQQPTYPAVMEEASYYAPAPVFSSPIGYPTVPY